MSENELIGRESLVWSKEPPTEPGYYWVRYIDLHGVMQGPEIIWLVKPGQAFEFGYEHVWELSVGCFVYGPRIECPQ